MSFKAEMEIKGIGTYTILSCSYNLTRSTDMKGVPQTKVQGGTFHVTVETSGDTRLSDWILDVYAHNDGEIKFYKTDADAVAKTLEFTNACLVDYSESFSSEGGMPMMASLTISAEIIKIGQGELDNSWSEGT